MFNFLRKLFIKDYENINDKDVRRKHGALAAIGGMVVNLLLFTFKILIGVITFSIAIITDAINNLTDLFSCFVNLFGFKIAAKPADKEHPYGHQRVEYIVALIISIIVTIVAVYLAYASIERIINQERIDINFWVFIILGLSIILKVLLGLFYSGLGKAINSVTLKATKQDSFNDAIITTGVLVSSIVIFFFPNLWWLDPGVSIIISLFIFYSGIKLIIESSSPLIGQLPSKDLISNIEKDISKYPFVLGIHNIMYHTYGTETMYMTIHIEVDGYKTVNEAHNETDIIENEIKEKYGIDLVIHLDPVDTQNLLLPHIKEEITCIVKNNNEKIDCHEVRVDTDKKSISFDVVFPREFKDKEFIINKIKSDITKTYTNYTINIKAEDDFIN